MNINPVIVERIARVCHEANRAYALAFGEDPLQIHPSWDACPEKIRESARYVVINALEGATPEQLHESWTKTKLEDGWHYGTNRSNELKLHPCLVPYDQLPGVQRKKDSLFYNIVNTLK